MIGNPEEGARSSDFRPTFNSMIAFSQAFAKPLEALLRQTGTPGEMYLGGAHCIVGLIILPVFVTLADGPNVPYPYGVIATAVVTVALIAHRIERFNNQRKGLFTHSLAPGKSWIPGPDALVQGFAEPALVIAAGIAAKTVLIGLGHYLVLAGIALAINANWQNMARLARARATRDAFLDQMAHRNGFGGKG